MRTRRRMRSTRRIWTPVRRCAGVGMRNMLLIRALALGGCRPGSQKDPVKDPRVPQDTPLRALQR
eukprot:7586159-Pyramimonas_sp.AAC.1